MPNDLNTLKQQLLQLRDLHAAGALPQDQYDQARAPLEQRLLEAVMAQPAPVRSSRRLLLAVAGAVVLIAGAGYWWTGSPGLLAGGGDSARANPHATGEVAPHATDAAQMSAMVEQLAERLQKEPANAEGWAMLARSYTVLERHADALKAYEKAAALAPKDAELLADYADALALKNNRQLAGEPMKWVERALKADPHNLKALALAGTHAWDRQDYKGAAKYWQQLVDSGTPDNELVRQIEPGLALAREKAGLPAPAARAASPAGTAAAAVSGTVTLAPALASRAAPEDTVFIYARDAQGSRMPLAILRKQVRDLPYRFTLDDSLAMSPAAKLSGAAQVIVEARISKSGEARAQPGDLSGQTGPVRPGTGSLSLEIRDTVKP